MCITKLDVLDEMPVVRLCTSYRLDGERRDTPPGSAEELGRCEPIYEDMPGWKARTVGIRSRAGLPPAARAFIERTRSACRGSRIDLVSTGAGRGETIVERHPFD